MRNGLSYFTYAKQPTVFQSRIEQVTAIAADEMTRFLFSTSSPVESQLQTNNGTITIEVKASAAFIAGGRVVTTAWSWRCAPRAPVQRSLRCRTLTAAGRIAGHRSASRRGRGTAATRDT